MAAVLCGADFIGFEIDEEYLALAAEAIRAAAPSGATNQSPPPASHGDEQLSFL